MKNNAQHVVRLSLKFCGLNAARTSFLHITVTSRLLTALRNDKRAIFRAATAAQAASEFILARMAAPDIARAA